VSTYIATLNDTVIARSDQTVLIEGNRYFPPDSIRDAHFTRTRMKSLCFWKGIASYYTVSERRAPAQCRLDLPASLPARQEDQEPCGVLGHDLGHRRVIARLLQACSYAMAHPETAQLVPARGQHSVLDPIENVALRQWLPVLPTLRPRVRH